MKLLVITGGRHPYEESTPILNDFLSAAGHDVTVTDSAATLADSTAMGSYDALVFNTRRENIPDFEMALAPAEQEGMAQFIRSGKGFVCIHISTCLSNAWPEYHDITGGGWITGTSFHPPYGEFTVNVCKADHPGVQGVSDFSTNDELYMGLAYGEGNDIFLTGDSERDLAVGAGPGADVYARRHLPPGLDPHLRRRQGLCPAAGPRRPQL